MQTYLNFIGMNRKDFSAFMETLEPFNGGGDKATINRNYKRILPAGFRCNRRQHCYEHAAGFRISYTCDGNGMYKWIQI